VRLAGVNLKLWKLKNNRKSFSNLLNSGSENILKSDP
jgi:hypothetical protein